MKKLIAISAFLFISITSGAQFQGTGGEIKGPFVWKSTIYPGTDRNYWLYVPRQYVASKPACVMVLQDGLGCAKSLRLPDVLDSLLALKKIPVMIGIFIEHGKVAPPDSSAFTRFNRSFEYDARGDRYARFLLEEIIPEVKKTYNLSTDPDDCSIGGMSSGAICAFNAAWERPDAFHRVFSGIGTYVGLRGGEEFATLVRKTEPKPLRVFLEDGTQDLNIYAGDWWMANQTMLTSLTYAGYEVNHAWGEGGEHNSRHASKILPQALVWLWENYPARVKTHRTIKARVNPIIADEPWKPMATDASAVEKIAVSKNRQLFFTSKNTIYRADTTGKISAFATLKGSCGGLAFGSDGVLYVVNKTSHAIVAIGENGNQIELIPSIDATFLTTSQRGIFFSDSAHSRLGFYGFRKKEIVYTAVPGSPDGLSLNSEQTFLNVSIAGEAFGYSCMITESGTLAFGQAYTHYHVPYGETSPEAGGLAVDTENLLYSATAMGVQVSDQLGRVNFIFSQPSPGVSDVKIGGPHMNILYAVCNGRLFRRKITGKGVLTFLAAVKPPAPGL